MYSVPSGVYTYVMRMQRVWWGEIVEFHAYLVVWIITEAAEVGEDEMHAGTLGTSGNGYCIGLERAAFTIENGERDAGEFTFTKLTTKNGRWRK
ncbi:Hypothetical predicted protein [Olea europaea subsp. europaea]|uniref:Uncharacterized protein n=1 Tax=Olea europaea subsp. europaea TaxID=158383 RepID=A0A8S0RQL0_OLEEU|nr:Hypothetical predicted protein [Olea europaea subsp. europaea]